VLELPQSAPATRGPPHHGLRQASRPARRTTSRTSEPDASGRRVLLMAGPRPPTLRGTPQRSVNGPLCTSNSYDGERTTPPITENDLLEWGKQDDAPSGRTRTTSQRASAHADERTSPSWWGLRLVSGRVEEGESQIRPGVTTSPVASTMRSACPNDRSASERGRSRTTPSTSMTSVSGNEVRPSPVMTVPDRMTVIVMVTTLPGFRGRLTSPGAVERPAVSAGTVPARRPAHRGPRHRPAPRRAGRELRRCG
jgi:hypothetical protein